MSADGWESLRLGGRALIGWARLDPFLHGPEGWIGDSGAGCTE